MSAAGKDHTANHDSGEWQARAISKIRGLSESGVEFYPMFGELRAIVDVYAATDADYQTTASEIVRLGELVGSQDRYEESAAEHRIQDGLLWVSLRSELGVLATMRVAHTRAQLDAAAAEVCALPDDPKTWCRRCAEEVDYRFSALHAHITRGNAPWVDPNGHPAIVTDGRSGHTTAIWRNELPRRHGSAGALVAITRGLIARPCGQCIGCRSHAETTRHRVARWVYFVQAGANGPIKIGCTSNVSARLAQLQTAQPEKLQLLAAVPGGEALESALHAAFAEHRMMGEWFRPCAALHRLIAEMEG